MTPWIVFTRSAQQTRSWGRSLATLLEGGEIIGLTGELGTGKTCFVRGLAEGLGVGAQAWIRSPTFTLVNEYQGRVPLYHIDLYRLGSVTEVEDLNLREYLYSDGVSVIEWFEKVPASERDEHLEVKFALTDRTARKLTFTAAGERYEELVEGLKGLKGYKG